MSPLGSHVDAASAQALLVSGSHTGGGYSVGSAGGGAASGPGDAAGRAWFQGWGEGSASVLHADVESQAKGMSATQHAERVLGHLIESS